MRGVFYGCASLHVLFCMLHDENKIFLPFENQSVLLFNYLFITYLARCSEDKMWARISEDKKGAIAQVNNNLNWPKYVYKVSSYTPVCE
jgi:hypothetical protein